MPRAWVECNGIKADLIPGRWVEVNFPDWRFRAYVDLSDYYSETKDYYTSTWWHIYGWSGRYINGRPAILGNIYIKRTTPNTPTVETYSRSFDLTECHDWESWRGNKFTFNIEYYDVRRKGYVDLGGLCITVTAPPPTPPPPPPPVEHTLVIESTAGGTTEPRPGRYTYLHGKTVSVTAIPSTGYQFDHWTLDGVVRRENPIVFTMDRDYRLTAYFRGVVPPPPPPPPPPAPAPPTGLAMIMIGVGLSLAGL